MWFILWLYRVKDEKLRFTCFDCGEKNKKSVKNLIKDFPNTYDYCNGDINKSFLLLRKVFYPYEYMDSWKRFDKTLLHNKEAFYSSLKIEDITDADYRHAKKVFKDFNDKNLGNYHDLSVQIITWWCIWEF